MSYSSDNKETLECKSCPHTFEQQHKFGCTIHCVLEPTQMDVTHVKGKSLLCPLLKAGE